MPEIVANYVKVVLGSIVHSGTTGTIRNNTENMGGTEVERGEDGSEKREKGEIPLRVRIKLF